MRPEAPACSNTVLVREREDLRDSTDQDQERNGGEPEPGAPHRQPREKGRTRLPLCYQRYTGQCSELHETEIQDGGGQNAELEAYYEASGLRFPDPLR